MIPVWRVVSAALALGAPLALLGCGGDNLLGPEGKDAASDAAADFATEAPEDLAVGAPADLIVDAPVDLANDAPAERVDARPAGRVAPRVDVNCDGFDDLVTVVVPVASNAPNISIFLGSAAGLAKTPTVLTDPAVDPLPVYSAFGAFSSGDVNGDGCTDIIVGAPYPPSGPEFRPQNLPGKAYLYLGSRNGVSTTPNLTLTGPGGANGAFGSSIASADVNHDGFTDVMITEPRLSERGVHVFFGSANGIGTSPSTTISGQGVTSAGDVNGDGFDDLVVTAEAGRASPELEDAGVWIHFPVYLVLGGPRGPTSTPVMFAAGSELHSVGSVIDGQHDLNGDGYDDVVLSTAHAPDSVLVYLGGSGGLGSVWSMQLLRPGEDEWFAFDVVSPGDLDGDGFSDLVVTARKTDGTPDPGRAYVYPGSARGVSATPAATITPPDGGIFGGFAEAAGDLDGDHHPDVLVRDLYNGPMYVYAGRRTGWLTPAPIVTIPAAK